MITLQLKTRIITAVFMIVGFLLLLIFLKSNFSYLPFLSCLVFSLVTILGLWELAKIGEAAVYRNISPFIFLLFFSLPLIVYLVNNYWLGIYLPMGMTVLLSAVCFCCYGMLLGRDNLFLTNNLYRFLFPAFVMLFGLLSLLHLIIGEREIPLILWLVAIVALNDTAAYFIGRRYGRTKMAPAISPNKTINGFLGGLVVSLIVGLPLLKFVFPNFSFITRCTLAVLVVLFAVFGDLIESYLKRNSGLKDSSQILPGHGGILDRLDAMIMAAPVLLLYNDFYV